MSKKDSKNVSSFFKSVYVPEFSESDEELIRGSSVNLKTMDEIKKEVEGKVNAITSLLNSDFLKKGEYQEPRLLSNEEGKAHHNDKQKLLGDVKRIQGKLKNLEDIIDSKLKGKFTWNFKKRPKLRKALKHVTGKAKNNITYEDYKKALQVKKELESQGGAEYFTRTED